MLYKLLFDILKFTFKYLYLNIVVLEYFFRLSLLSQIIENSILYKSLIFILNN